MPWPYRLIPANFNKILILLKLAITVPSFIKRLILPGTYIEMYELYFG